MSAAQTLTIDSAAAIARMLARHWGVAAVLVVTFMLHAPTLRYFFDGDDFVVLGSVEHLGARQYIVDSWRMEDIVPSWRPLIAVIYAAEWHTFGLNPAGWRAVNLGVHLASVFALYALVLRTTRRPAVGAVAAMIFGVSGAHFDTVNYITAFPHVLSTFFVLASLVALISYAEDGERNAAAFWLAFVLFTLAFLSDESSFVFAPLLAAAYALYARRWRRRPLRLFLHVAPFAALASGWLSFYESCSCAQLKFDDYYWGPHVARNYAVYLSWLVYPVRSIQNSPDAARWILAVALAAVALAVSARGPNIARVATLGIVLSILPFAPVKVWVASRYSYAAVAFFAPIAAIVVYAIFDRIRGTHRWVRAPATAVALLFVATVGALYAWQTHAQHERSGRYGERWRLLAEELRANYATVPDGTTIYIIDGPWQNPMEQYAWVPSVARALYGDATAFDLPRDAYAHDPPDPRHALFLEYRDGHLHPVSLQQVIATHP